jgi:hypothetical protein
MSLLLEVLEVWKVASMHDTILSCFSLTLARNDLWRVLIEIAIVDATKDDLIDCVALVLCYRAIEHEFCVVTIMHDGISPS